MKENIVKDVYPKLKRISFVLFPVQLVLIFLLVVVLIKNTYYADWTWLGFATDIKKLSVFFVIVGPFLLFIWHLYNTKDPKKQLIIFLKAVINGEKIIFIQLYLLAIIILLTIANITIKKTYDRDLTFFLLTHNWEFAQKELSVLKTEPIEENIIKTYEYYINVDQAIDNSKYPDGDSLRQQRNAILKLLNDGCDINNFNTISYSESCLEIYFTEKDSTELSKGIQFLKNKITVENEANLDLKIAEMYISMKNYDMAQMYLLKGLKISNDNILSSLYLVYLGNTFVRQGKVKQAIELYIKAEENYPDNRKFLYYSNLGYCLILDGRYDEAVQKIQHALSIKPDDWYSYLNLGLAYEGLNQYLDAIHSYEYTISKTDNTDAKREAFILKGRCQEIAGMGNKVFLKTYLQALNRDTSSIQISNIIKHNAQSQIYTNLSVCLIQTNTHGIEKYINWFKEKAQTQQKNH